jgi:protein TonB
MADPMQERTALERLLATAASLGLHVAGVTAIVLGATWDNVHTTALLAELIEPEARPAPPPPAPRPAPRPAVPDRRPLTLPRPIEAPRPVEPPPVAAPVAPAPPKPVVPEPGPVPAPKAVPPVAAAPAAPGGPPARVPSGPGVVADPDPGPAAFAARLPAGASPGGVAAGPSAAARGPAGGADAAVATAPSGGVTQRALPRGGYQYRPAYPPRARDLRIQGTTVLEVLITVDGRVTEVAVKQSAGHPDLDQAAVDAVRRWRFEPARRGAEPVAMRVELPFEFRLR